MLGDYAIAAMLFILTILPVTAAILFLGKKDKKEKNESEKMFGKLYLKDNEAAFEIASKYFNDPVIQGKNLSVGIVIIAYKSDQDQTCLIQLAGLLNGKEVLVGGITTNFSRIINIGDLVYWAPLDDSIAAPNYLEVVAYGHILAILAPEIDLKTSKMTIVHDFSK